MRPLPIQLLPLVALIAGLAHGQTERHYRPPLDQSAWLNSPPLSLDMLEGKGAVIYFFEEQCPHCRDNWPGLMQLANQYAGKPVIFIAVNSGSRPQEVQQYVRQLQITWPVVIDTYRTMEKAAAVSEISLNNIMQVRVLRPDGSLVPGDWSDMQATAERALQGAAWKVDPAIVPPALRSAWMAVETGNYAAAAAGIKRGLGARDDETKEAAAKMMAVVQPKIDAIIAEAKEAVAAGDMLTALDLYTQLEEQFLDYGLPPEVLSQRKELARHPQVKAAQKATRELETVRKMWERSQSPSTRKRAEDKLNEIIQEMKGTKLADEALELLIDVSANPDKP